MPFWLPITLLCPLNNLYQAPPLIEWGDFMVAPGDPLGRPARATNETATVNVNTQNFMARAIGFKVHFFCLFYLFDVAN